MLEVTAAKYVSGYTLWLSFSDGTEGNVDLDDLGQFKDKRVESRQNCEALFAHILDLTHMDVSEKQIVSVSMYGMYC